MAPDRGDDYDRRELSVTEDVQAVRDYWLSYYVLRRLTLHDFERARRID